MNNERTSDTCFMKKAEVLLNDLSFEEKLGQLVGYNPAHWSVDDLEKDYSFGVGQVSLLVGTEKKCVSDVAEYQKKLQRKIMDMSPHNIPALFHVETLTGLKLPDATSFPTGIGQAATFDPQNQNDMGKVIGSQAQAVGAQLAFSPVLDISRDSRFGRQGETYGEDPTLSAAMGMSLIQGIQKDNKVASVAKHFLGYHGAEGGIHAATCDIPERSLREVYAKPFQAAITESNLRGIMPCYSTINSEPVSGSKNILIKLLRNEMGFQGITVSDYSAIQEIFERQRVEKSYRDAGKRALLAGMDQELPSRKCYSLENFKDLKDDKEFISSLNTAVLRVLTLKFELGLFDNPFAFDHSEVTAIYEEKESYEVSLNAARESFVLIKNDGVLPLKNKAQKIGLIGCHADSIRSLFGGYSYMSTIEKRFGVKNTMAGVLSETTDEKKEIKPHHYSGSYVEKEHTDVEAFARKILPKTNSLFEQIKRDISEVEVFHSFGFPYVGDDCSYHDEALKVANDCDLVILTVGGKYGTGSTASIGEGIDATNINLPICQERFIEKVSKLGKPIVIIHFGGRPISSDAAEHHANAILEVWNPGELGNVAITKTLFGEYNPGGKMPVTTAYSSGQLPIYYNHLNGSSYHQNSGGAFKGYMDCPHEPRYYFGHGLSYTSFDYSDLSIQKSSHKTDKITITLNIKNTGSVAGEEVVQLYVKNCNVSMVRPNIELLGFYRVNLNTNQSKKIEFTVDETQLAFLDENMKWKIEEGQIEFLVGSSVADIRLNENFEIKEDRWIDGKNRSFVSSVREI